MGKKPGAGWAPQVEDLSFSQQARRDMRPYDRLIGAALNGERWLFARAGDRRGRLARRRPGPRATSTPVHAYAQGSWGPKEADALLPDGDAPGTTRSR